MAVDTEALKNEGGKMVTRTLAMVATLAGFSYAQKHFDDKAAAAGKEPGMEMMVISGATAAAGTYATTLPSVASNPYMKAAAEGVAGAGALKFAHTLINRGAGTQAKDANGKLAVNEDGTPKMQKQKLNLGLSGNFSTGSDFGLNAIESASDLDGYGDYLPTAVGEMGAPSYDELPAIV